MAYNVFGNPITTETLRGMPKYADKPVITRTDRAREGLNMKNAADKDVNATNYVENLKKQWGTGVSTLCLVYNATGDPLQFVTSHDYHGHIGQAPYPVKMANGQWGAFLHVKTSWAVTGSSAAVVYHGLNQNDVNCDWMFAWSNPWNRMSWDNTAYTEIREAHHYDGGQHWNYISDLIDKSSLNSNDEWNGCLSYASTGSDTSPKFEAILTLKDDEPGVYIS